MDMAAWPLKKASMEKSTNELMQLLVTNVIESMNGVKKVLAEMEKVPTMQPPSAMPDFNAMFSGLSGTPLAKPNLTQETPSHGINEVTNKKEPPIKPEGCTASIISISILIPEIRTILLAKRMLSRTDITQELFQKGFLPECSKKTKGYVSSALSMMKKRNEVERTQKYKGLWKLINPESRAGQPENPMEVQSTDKQEAI